MIESNFEKLYVYIMNNKPNGVLYIGITDRIEERVKEHKLKVYPKWSDLSISWELNYNKIRG